MIKQRVTEFKNSFLWMEEHKEIRAVGFCNAKKKKKNSEAF